MKNEEPMIVFPNAKINLGLKVLSKRDDGFHEIETLFYPIGLCDILEVIKSPDGKFSFTASGMPVDGNPGDNLCVKAYDLLAREKNLPPVMIQLHKVIPMGAGIGGGSADAAFLIRMLNDIFSIGMETEEMEQYAARLGSDCPFFIRNKQATGTGTGNILNPIDQDLSSLKILLVKPQVKVNTKEAYDWIDSIRAGTDEKHHHPFLDGKGIPPEQWKVGLVNDFETPVFSRHPEIAKIKDILYQKGAAYASMSGSGAAVYGLFNEMPEDLTGFEGCFTWTGNL
jgi:4-diphosphocytidyl-2-C-methyl-D-erythritol kinase